MGMEILPVSNTQTRKSQGYRTLGGVYLRVLPQECGKINLRVSKTVKHPVLSKRILNPKSIKVDLNNLTESHNKIQGNYSHYKVNIKKAVVVVQSLSHVWLFPNPWNAAHKASLSIASFWSFVQTHVHQVSDANQPSHPLLSPSPSGINISQHQSLFQ